MYSILNWAPRCGGIGVKEVYLHLFFSLILQELESSDSRYGRFTPGGSAFFTNLNHGRKNTD
jgi:hypothetical protein